MKYFAAVTVLLLLSVASAYNEQPQRFERLSDEHFDIKYNHAEEFEVWHDKVSGKEVMCVFGHAGAYGESPLSCLLTGREWK